MYIDFIVGLNLTDVPANMFNLLLSRQICHLKKNININIFHIFFILPVEPGLDDSSFHFIYVFKENLFFRSSIYICV